VAEKFRMIATLSPDLPAGSYSATFFSHDASDHRWTYGLPLDAPIVINIEGPLLKSFYLTFKISYVLELLMQVLCLCKQNLNS
jgi:hypothetical protein